MDIQRSPAEVFDYCTDLSHEPEWNPRTRRIHKLTDGPIGQGTRYQGEWIKGDPMTIEFVRFERPTAWASVGRSRRLVANSNGQVPTTRGGTRLVVRIELGPQGGLAVAASGAGPIMRRREERNLRAIKVALER